MEVHFPDVVPLIGEKELADVWVKNPRGALITIKVSCALPLPLPYSPPIFPFRSLVHLI